MRLPEHERDAHREAFRRMSLPQKAEYVLAYYKLPLVITLVALVFLGSVARYLITHKDAMLYVAYANVSLADEQDEDIFDGFLEELGADPRTSEVYRYYGVYLSDAEDSADHQLSYASRLKVLAAIDAEELDVVLMNRDAYDLLSNSGYLMDLDAALLERPGLLDAVSGLLVSNVVVLEDNRIEVELGEADEYVAQTIEVTNALDVTGLIAGEGELTDTVYLGVIGNTPRLEAALAFIAHLVAGAA